MEWTEEEERQLVDLHLTMENINGSRWNDAFALARSLTVRQREDCVTEMRGLMRHVYELCMESIRSYRRLEIDLPPWKVAMAAQVMCIETLMTRAREELEHERTS